MQATTMIGHSRFLPTDGKLKMTTGGWVFVIDAWTAIFSPHYFLLLEGASQP